MGFICIRRLTPTIKNLELNLNYVIPSTVFTLISNVATTNFIIVWCALLVCHLLYKRTADSANNPFKLPLFPLSNVATLVFFIAVTVILCFDTVNRWAVIGSVVWFVALLVIERGCTGYNQKINLNQKTPLSRTITLITLIGLLSGVFWSANGAH